MQNARTTYNIASVLLVLALVLGAGGDSTAPKGATYHPGLAAHYYQDALYWDGNWTATLKPKVKAEDWTFTKYAYTRVEPVINHLFIRRGWFSVRWQGYLNTEILGKDDKEAMYDFRIEAEDGCRLFIDGKKLIDSWNDTDSDAASQQRKARILLTPGKRHRLVVEYFLGHNRKAKRTFPAKLYWSCEARGISEEIIPAAQLSHTVADLPPKPGRKN